MKNDNSIDTTYNFYFNIPKNDILELLVDNTKIEVKSINEIFSSSDCNSDTSCQQITFSDYFLKKYFKNYIKVTLKFIHLDGTAYFIPKYKKNNLVIFDFNVSNFPGIFYSCQKLKINSLIFNVM
jgi:hypothetical protein